MSSLAGKEKTEDIVEELKNRRITKRFFYYFIIVLHLFRTKIGTK